jgi:hypothetical protein
MPQAAVVAGIQAGAAIGAGVLSSRSSGRAQDRQYRATQEALQFEREKEEQRRKEYEQQQQQLKAEWEAYQARRRPYWEAADRLIRGAGGQAPERPTAMPVGWSPEGAGAGSAAPTSFRAPYSAGGTFPTPSGAGAGASSSGVGPALIPNARFRANWNDWDNYGA